MGEAKEWVQNGIRRFRESGPPEKSVVPSARFLERYITFVK